MPKGKITVTLEADLVEALDREAEAMSKTRSHVVGLAVAEWRRAKTERELAEGYRAMAEENLKVAEAGLAAGYEAMK